MQNEKEILENLKKKTAKNLEKRQTEIEYTKSQLEKEFVGETCFRAIVFDENQDFPIIKERLILPETLILYLQKIKKVIQVIPGNQGNLFFEQVQPVAK